VCLLSIEDFRRWQDSTDYRSYAPPARWRGRE
jgi:hypothetical protein